MLIAHYPVGLALKQYIHRIGSHNGSIIAVHGGGIAAALHIAQNGGPGLHSGSRLYAPCHGRGMSDALCVDNQVMGLSPLTALDDMVDDLLLVILILFGQKNILGSVCHAAPKGNITCMAAHYLYNTASLMRGGGILHLVDGLHRRIDRRIKANRIIGACNIQVDGAGQSHRVDPQPGKRLRSAIGAVAANDNNAVDTVLRTDISALLLILGPFELQTAGRAKHRSAALDNIGHMTRLHVDNVLV